jgi:hypothetical protein
LSALRGIELYVRALIKEVNEDLDDLEKVPETLRWTATRTRLLAKKHAYKEVLQYIKDGKGIL